jgi:hypothetical protein
MKTAALCTAVQRVGRSRYFTPMESLEIDYSSSGILWWDARVGDAAGARRAAEVARYRKVEGQLPPTVAEVLRRLYGLRRPKQTREATAASLGIEMARLLSLEREGLLAVYQAFGAQPPWTDIPRRRCR